MTVELVISFTIIFNNKYPEEGTRMIKVSLVMLVVIISNYYLPGFDKSSPVILFIPLGP